MSEGSASCLASIAWARANGMGPIRWLRWMADLGSISAIEKATDDRLAASLGVSSGEVARWRSTRDVATVRRELRRLHRRGGWCLSQESEAYPELWRGMPDPPIAVQGLGALAALGRGPIVSIVGARRASPLGLDLAGRFAAAFAEAGWIVCSGGARGVDAAVHRAVLRIAGTTGVILGSGLGRPYPPEHDSMFRAIVDRGGFLLSEFAFDRPPRPAQFPLRNRLLAGIAIGVVVVEAGARSGALITARLAAEDYGREVVALPGRADQDVNAGGHRAIREGWAMLVDRPEQAIEAFEAQVGLHEVAGASGHRSLENRAPPSPTRPM